MTKKDTDIIIVGAGLTGLTLAYYLRKAGKNVLMLEKNHYTGGVIQTIQQNGFTFESGPNTGVIATPELVELFENLGSKIEIETPQNHSKSRWIWKSNRWHALPSGLQSAIATPLFSFFDKIRILGEPFRKKGTNPNETIANLVKRRMGKSYLTYAVDPFISGIYAGDPEHLVTRFALPKLHALEQNYGSFIKGAIKKSKLPKSELEKKTTREVFSVKGGLSHLINALTNEIGTESIITGIESLQIQHSKNGFQCRFKKDGQIETLTGLKVITTVDGHTLEDLLPFVEKKLLDKISCLNYAKVIQAVACYSNWKGIQLNAFGGLVPSAEKRDVLGILFPSALFENRAPENGAILSVFIGGIKKPDFFRKTDAEIESIVLKEVKEMMRCEEKPDLLRIYRYRKAIPQYELSTEKRLDAINSIEQKYKGLILAGNIRDGIGMADRVKQARNIANQIISES